MDSPCIKQTVCKVFKIFQCGKYLVAYVLNHVFDETVRFHCLLFMLYPSFITVVCLSLLDIFCLAVVLNYGHFFIG